jgi:Tfp pilus assembly protein PilV
MKQNRQQGTSLVEVILCMFMLTVLLVLYASALNTVALTRKLRYENLAYHIANKQMETLRNTGYDSLPASGNIVDAQLAQIPAGAGTFTTAAYPGYGGVKQIIVTVTWTDPSAKQVELRTLAGTGGINP